MIISYNRNNHTKKGTKNYCWNFDQKKKIYYCWNILVIYTGTASNFNKGARNKSLNH